MKCPHCNEEIEGMTTSECLRRTVAGGKRLGMSSLEPLEAIEPLIAHEVLKGDKMDREDLRDLLVVLCDGDKVLPDDAMAILAEFDRLTEELKQAQMAEGYLQQSVDALKQENKKLLVDREAVDALKELAFEKDAFYDSLEAKAEALDRICEPIREGHKDWGITEHKKLIRAIELDNDPEITPAWNIALASLERICDYLDSQQKPKDEEVLREILNKYIEVTLGGHVITDVHDILIADILEHFQRKEK